MCWSGPCVATFASLFSRPAVHEAGSSQSHRGHAAGLSIEEDVHRGTQCETDEVVLCCSWHKLLKASLRVAKSWATTGSNQHEADAATHANDPVKLS